MCAGANAVASASASGQLSTARTRGHAATPARAGAGLPAARALVLANCTRARRDPGGIPGLPEAAGGVVGPRGGRDSARLCPPVTHGTAGVSGALGDGSGAHRAAIARFHSVRIKFSVNISARVLVYHWDRTKWARDHVSRCLCSVWSHSGQRWPLRGLDVRSSAWARGSRGGRGGPRRASK